MPRVHYVKNAQKDHPEIVVKKGEPYYWWKHKLQRGGLLKKSKTWPRPSQLTLSEFIGGVLSAGEGFEDALAAAICCADLVAARDEYVSELQNIMDETQGKFDNMPEGLQQGDTGQLLEGRVNSVQELIDELEGVDIPEDDEVGEDESEDEVAEENGNKMEAARDELSLCEYQGE